MRLTAGDLLRIGGVLVLAAALAFFLPTWTPLPQDSLVPIMLIFSFLAVFLINRAMERKRELGTSVAVELSRLRRIKHVAEGITDGIWKRNLYDALTRYQTKIGENFVEHGRTLGSFRELTHLIYGYEPRTVHEGELIEDLLATTRELALERQKIEQRLADPILPSSLLAVGIIALFVIIMLLGTREPAQASKLGASFGVASIFLAFDFLLQKNRLSRREVSSFQEMYKRNIAKTRE